MANAAPPTARHYRYLADARPQTGLLQRRQQKSRCRRPNQRPCFSPPRRVERVSSASSLAPCATRRAPCAAIILLTAPASASAPFPSASARLRVRTRALIALPLHASCEPPPLGVESLARGYGHAQRPLRSSLGRARFSLELLCCPHQLHLSYCDNKQKTRHASVCCAASAGQTRDTNFTSSFTSSAAIRPSNQHHQC